MVCTIPLIFVARSVRPASYVAHEPHKLIKDTLSSCFQLLQCQSNKGICCEVIFFLSIHCFTLNVLSSLVLALSLVSSVSAKVSE